MQRVELYLHVSLEGQVEFGKGREKLVRHILSKGLEVGCGGHIGHNVEFGIGRTQGREETGLRWSTLQ